MLHRGQRLHDLCAPARGTQLPYADPVQTKVGQYLAALSVAVFGGACGSSSSGGYVCGPGTMPVDNECVPVAEDASGSSQPEAGADAQPDSRVGATLGTLCASDPDCSMATVPAPLSAGGWTCTPYGCSFVCSAVAVSTPMCGSISCSQVCTELGGTCVPPVNGSSETVCRSP